MMRNLHSFGNLEAGSWLKPCLELFPSPFSVLTQAEISHLTLHPSISAALPSLPLVVFPNRPGVVPWYLTSVA